jgi:hypothetical protein
MVRRRRPSSMVERGSLRGLCDQPPISEMRESPLRSGARRLAVHRADSNGSLRHCSGQHRTMPSGSAASARLCNGSTTAPLHVRRGGAEGTPVFAALRAVRAGLCGSRWRFPIFIGYSDFGVDSTSPVPRHRAGRPMVNLPCIYGV